MLTPSKGALWLAQSVTNRTACVQNFCHHSLPTNQLLTSPTASRSAPRSRHFAGICGSMHLDFAINGATFISFLTADSHLHLLTCISWLECGACRWSKGGISQVMDCRHHANAMANQVLHHTQGRSEFLPPAFRSVWISTVGLPRVPFVPWSLSNQPNVLIGLPSLRLHLVC